MTEVAMLARGRDADVFALDAQRVLRRYREGGDVAAEAVVMAYVGEHGFPVPRVYAAEAADLVMERLDGPTTRAEVASLASAATLVANTL